MEHCVKQLVYKQKQTFICCVVNQNMAHLHKVVNITDFICLEQKIYYFSLLFFGELLLQATTLIKLY